MKQKRYFSRGQRKAQAYEAICEYHMRGGYPTLRMIAKKIGVSPSSKLNDILDEMVLDEWIDVERYVDRRSIVGYKRCFFPRHGSR